MNRFELPNPFIQSRLNQHFFSERSSSSYNQHEIEFGIRHSGVSDEFKVEYTPFDGLPQFLPNTDMMQLFEKLKEDFDSSEWMSQFIAIDTLRCLNKYFSDDITYFFEAFGVYIQNALFSFKTCIVKNILLFATEVFQLAKSSSLSITIVKHLIDIIIPKTASVSKTIRLCASQAMVQFIDNCLCDETIQTLCFASATKNSTFNEKAFYYLTIVLDKMKETVASLQPMTLKTIFQCLAFTLSSKSTVSKHHAKSILKYLNQLMGPHNFMNYIRFLYEEDALKIEHADLLVLKIQEKNEVRPSLAMDLKRRRSTLSNYDTSSHHIYIAINGEFVA
jgi:hypothetical protein